ncbi:hypothetical protein [Dyadobacter luticola]|uniref:DUF2281 domain-containing protein n=1 Tax=Dyadobacter luticola TaxID=1979387 RepID=A0A5R9KX16_9BACT|nr:hypothetical protein [Dyadobacter luticola]TLV00826.1 hypothetical protein FEN17_15215 [Dyadobacter luticola]
MIKTVMVPDNQNVSLKLPESYIGKQVEIIAFTANEVFNDPKMKDKPLTHHASQAVLSRDWSNSEEDSAWENL